MALDHQGEVYAIAKWTGQKTKDVKARLGDTDQLPSVKEAHQRATKIVTDRLEGQSPLTPYAARQDEAQPNRPVDTLRDGNLKASIWRNEGENGVNYSTTFARTWRDDKGKWHDSQSYSGTDMLRLGELSRTAYHRANELRREQTQMQSQDQSQDSQKRMAFEQKRGQAGPDQHQHRER